MSRSRRTLDSEASSSRHSEIRSRKSLVSSICRIRSCRSAAFIVSQLSDRRLAADRLLVPANRTWGAQMLSTHLQPVQETPKQSHVTANASFLLCPNHSHHRIGDGLSQRLEIHLGV